MCTINESRQYVHSSTALDALAQLLGTVILVQEVVGDLLEVRQVAVEKCRADGEEVRVTRVVDLHHAPRVLAGADLAAANLHHVLGADNSEGHEASKLRVLLDRVLVVLLDVVREVVHGDPVVLDVLHNQFLGLGKLARRQRVGAADDGYHVDTGGKALH